MRLAVKSHRRHGKKKVNPELQQNTIGLLDIRIQKSHVVGTEKGGKPERNETEEHTHAHALKKFRSSKGCMDRWVKKRYMEREFGAVPGSG